MGVGRFILFVILSAGGYASQREPSSQTPKNSLTMRIIGLTGGIATGKSTVARYLAEAYHLSVLDADIYARDAVRPASPILAAIFARYGTAVRDPQGNLDRSALGKIIFSQQGERRWLEQQIHPFVRDRLMRDLAALGEDIAVCVVPLLFEAQMTDLVSEIWVVTCSESEQLQRLQQRDRLDPQSARERIAAQMPLEEKVAAADVVIDNSSDRQRLYRQIDNALGIDGRAND